MTATIIIIGNEILNGRITDTNSGWLAKELDARGIETYQILSIPDESAAIQDAVSYAIKRSRTVIVTGGLGPTKDDVTKHTLNNLLGDGTLIENPEVLKNAESVMRVRGRELNTLTATQAMVPACAEILMNEVGTAPGLVFTQGESRIFCLPGVPFEMRRMFTDSVLPLLGKDNGWHHHFFKVWGISESALAEKLAEFENTLDGRLAYLPDGGVVTLRLDCRDSVKSETFAGLLCNLIGDYLLGEGEHSIAGLLLEQLKDAGLTVATAESCTGGNIVHRMTEIPGATAAVKGGVVAYLPEVKINILGVEKTVIESRGVVSAEVAEQMAEGVCRKLKSDLGIATTGIAGPSGAEPGKPVGTVWMAWCLNGETHSQCFHFPGSRQRVIDMATNTALARAIMLLREKL